MQRLLILLTLIVAQSIPAVAESREKDLDRWVDRDLIPYVNQQLILHPRFKNETVMFVVLDDNAPAPASNALALAIRDRLLAAAVATPGVAIGWQQGRDSAGLESQAHDCAHDDVHYYIGIELTQKLDGQYAVNARALDLEDRTWVTGFGRRWQGKLNTSQRQAMRQERVDQTFLGARDVPFTLAQTDLLAAHLAHRLSCTLQKRVEDEYVVSVDLVEPPAEGLEGTVELIGNNLASRQALTLSSIDDNTNAILGGKAHRIDGVLHQYWVTITPDGGDPDIAALSASAYIVLPDAAGPPDVPPTVTADVGSETHRRPLSIPNAGKDALLGAMRVTAPQSPADCRAQPCSVLQTQAHADAIVFFLAHQAHHGLVRLSSGDCRGRTTARIARRGQPLSFPIARTSSSPRNWAATTEWQAEPEADTYYALAVSDASTARRIANHLDRLPLRCSDALRPGLENEELRSWFNDFAVLTAQSAHVIDWRGVTVHNIL